MIFLGELSVGKTSLLRRFCTDSFEDRDYSTTGAFRVHEMEIDGRVVKLELWDTAGQERRKVSASKWSLRSRYFPSL